VSLVPQRLGGVKLCFLFSVEQAAARHVTLTHRSDGCRRRVHSRASNIPVTLSDSSGDAFSGASSRRARLGTVLAREGLSHSANSRCNIATSSRCGRRPPVNQSASVRIIADDFPSCIARREHVINGALELDPQSSWRVATFDLGRRIGEPKTSN
jgi:hypothetical protein